MSRATITLSATEKKGEIMKSWAFGLLGYLLGALTTPTWQHLGEVVRDWLFPPSDPVLHFRVQSGNPTNNLKLVVENTGGKSATIEALTITFCTGEIRLIDVSRPASRRPTVPIETASQDVRQRLSLGGDSQWAPKCASDRTPVVLIPTKDTLEIKPGKQVVTFQPSPGFVINGAMDRQAFSGRSCSLWLRYVATLEEAYSYEVFSVNLCDWT
jgi:hypothetical protein